jgi:hypothetical protein
LSLRLLLSGHNQPPHNARDTRAEAEASRAAAPPHPSCASITTRGSLPRNQETAGVSHLPSFDD